jgi:folylpolyglutamate synthase/dihydropteroate synthase
MADKDVEGIARLLFPAVLDVTLTTAPSPRAATAEELAHRIPPAAGGVSSSRSVAEALEELLAQGGSAPIIVAGSLYLVGEARAWLMARC